MRFYSLGQAKNVFEKGYALPSLEEVESHIMERKHLPGIPTEKEVLENGIDTAEMLRLQMQKIEELTLYVIELKKKINEMETR